MRPDQLCLEAEALLRTQQIPAALQRFEEAVRLAPDDGAGWRAYGRGLVAAKNFSAAITALERACGLDAGDVEARTTLAWAHQNSSRVEEAIHWYGQALALDPQSLVLQLNHACVWPVVADSIDQIHACRERCRELLAGFETDPALYLHPTHTATNHTFPLAYHGLDDRAWLENYARLLLRFLGGEGPGAAPLPSTTRPPRGGRMRLGFASAYFHAHSNTRAFEGLLRGLNRECFELVLIHLEGSCDDPVRRRLEAGVDLVVHCPSNVATTWQRLEALRLDLLFYTDVGMNPMLPALLCRRCAPVQVTGWGFPRTSGFPTLDYYLSGDLVEPGDGQDHYSESLIRLHGLPCRYLSEDLPEDPLAAAMGRSYFLLPEEVPLVGCLQTFWKMHPAFDAVLERIAEAVPEALFVFVEPTPPELAQLFLARLRRRAPAAAERLVVLAGMKRAEYGVLAGCLDLLLDTLHFGSGISFYESIFTGTPIVTVEGPYLRSRYVAAGYRLMGLQDAPVVHTPEAMADRAIALLRDPQGREGLRQRIREAARTHLYDRMDLVHSFEDFAVEAIARSRRHLAGP